MVDCTHSILSFLSIHFYFQAQFDYGVNESKYDEWGGYMGATDSMNEQEKMNKIIPRKKR